MLKNDHLAGPALGTVFVLGPLLAALVQRGILSKTDTAHVIDNALLVMEQLQSGDDAANRGIWEDARGYVLTLMHAAT